VPVLAIPSIMPFRGYMISNHVTAVMVHRLDGIEAYVRWLVTTILHGGGTTSSDTIGYYLV
jgi:hypothetical protein